MVGREFLISGRNASALRDRVEKPIDQIARTIQIRGDQNIPRDQRFAIAGHDAGFLFKD
jgi:hypothetical protein